MHPDCVTKTNTKRLLKYHHLFKADTIIMSIKYAAIIGVAECILLMWNAYIVICCYGYNVSMPLVGLGIESKVPYGLICVKMHE